ncbi:MAG: nitrile hydratase subunit beta [Xanthobacteraceae bacterium]
MNGLHDTGGKHGYGAVLTEANEPPFHAPWEGRMHGIAVTCQVSGVNTTPEQRTTIENMPPNLYLDMSYYEKWLFCYEKLLNDKGIVTTAELEQRIAEQAAAVLPAHPQEPASPSDYAVTVKRIIYNGTPHDRPIDRAPAFKVGDRVRAKNLNPRGHTRLPGFTKGKLGTIAVYHGAHCHHEPLADGRGEIPEHLYAVKFDGPELWGTEDGNVNDAVYVDLFENYIVRV